MKNHIAPCKDYSYKSNKYITGYAKTEDELQVQLGSDESYLVSLDQEEKIDQQMRAQVKDSSLNEFRLKNEVLYTVWGGPGAATYGGYLIYNMIYNAIDTGVSPGGVVIIGISCLIELITLLVTLMFTDQVSKLIDLKKHQFFIENEEGIEKAILETPDLSKEIKDLLENEELKDILCINNVENLKFRDLKKIVKYYNSKHEEGISIANLKDMGIEGSIKKLDKRK